MRHLVKRYLRAHLRVWSSLLNILTGSLQATLQARGNILWTFLKTKLAILVWKY